MFARSSKVESGLGREGATGKVGGVQLSVRLVQTTVRLVAFLLC